MLYAVILAGAWVIWHLGFRIRVYGREYLPRDRGFILAPNHLSAIDPVFVVLARFWGRRMLVLGKEEIFEVNPFFTWFLKYVGVVAVHRGKGDTQVIDEAIDAVKGGRGMLIFPEGTRVEHEGDLPAKGGVAVIGIRSGAQFVPVYVEGNKRIFRRTRIIFGQAYRPDAASRRPSPEEVQAIADEVLRRAYALGRET